jgi:predicted nucleic acid-binding protein
MRINYLIQIEQIDLLPVLFETVFIPEEVWDELRHSKAAVKVRHWVACHLAGLR